MKETSAETVTMCSAYIRLSQQYNKKLQSGATCIQELYLKFWVSVVLCFDASPFDFECYAFYIVVFLIFSCSEKKRKIFSNNDDNEAHWSYIVLFTCWR